MLALLSFQSPALLSSCPLLLFAGLLPFTCIVPSLLRSFGLRSAFGTSVISLHHRIIGAAKYYSLKVSKLVSVHSGEFSRSLPQPATLTHSSLSPPFFCTLDLNLPGSLALESRALVEIYLDSTNSKGRTRSSLSERSSLPCSPPAGANGPPLHSPIHSVQTTVAAGSLHLLLQRRHRRQNPRSVRPLRYSDHKCRSQLRRSRQSWIRPWGATPNL